MERLTILNSHLSGNKTSASKPGMLLITDTRTGIAYCVLPVTAHELVFQLTGKNYELPIENHSIQASDLAKITNNEGEVLRSYDPGYMNTINCVNIGNPFSFDKNCTRPQEYHSLMVIRAS